MRHAAAAVPHGRAILRNPGKYVDSDSTFLLYEFPGGNQVDGLPPALSFGQTEFLAAQFVFGFRLARRWSPKDNFCSQKKPPEFSKCIEQNTYLHASLKMLSVTTAPAMRIYLRLFLGILSLSHVQSEPGKCR